jgi:hypothetical protein
MRITKRYLAALSLGLGLIVSGTMVGAQDGPPLAKPTAERKLLAKDVGTWDTTVKS